MLLSDCQTVLVELLVAVVSQRITAEELALLIRLFLEKTPPIVNRAVTPQSCPVLFSLVYIEGVNTESLCSQCLHFPFCSMRLFL